jgi:hypothetical protein
MDDLRCFRLCAPCLRLLASGVAQVGNQFIFHEDPRAAYLRARQGADLR